MSRCSSVYIGYGSGGYGSGAYGGGRITGYRPDNLNNLLDAWDDIALPALPREDNWRFLRAVGAELECLDNEINNVDGTFHINDATGEQLELIADIANLNRQDGENDDELRARVKATVVAGLSDAVADYVIGFAGSLLEADPSNLRLQLDLNDQPKVVILRIPQTIFNDTTLTASQIQDLLNDALQAGARFELQTGGFPDEAFTLKGTGDVDDPDKALTGDNTSLGGKLIGDLT